MPKAELPSSPVGWITALGAGIVGFMAGFIFIRLMNGLFG